MRSKSFIIFFGSFSRVILSRSLIAVGEPLNWYNWRLLHCGRAKCDALHWCYKLTQKLGYILQ